MVMKVEDADDLRNVKSEWSANATLLWVTNETDILGTDTTTITIPTDPNPKVKSCTCVLPLLGAYLHLVSISHTNVCILDMCDHPVVGCQRPGLRYRTVVKNKKYIEYCHKLRSFGDEPNQRAAYIKWCQGLELEYLRGVIRNDGALHWEDFLQ
jgi:hypothetical protein